MPGGANMTQRTLNVRCAKMAQAWAKISVVRIIDLLSIILNGPLKKRN